MSEPRQKYSLSPMAELKHARDRNGNYRDLRDSGKKKPNMNRKGQLFLQFMMSVALPILFIVCLILGFTELHGLFILLSVICLASMWIRRAFVPQARPTLTLLYIALMIVSAAAILWFTKPLIKIETAAPAVQNNTSSLFSRDVTASDVSSFSVGTTTQGIRPTATPDSKSEAQSRLELFMAAWMNQDEESMLNYCTPAWKNSQSNPLHAIFTIRGISVPVDYTILNVAGDESYDSRTITMRAQIDRGTGQDPVTYQYDVLLIRVNGVWYIDPNSLSSHTEIKVTAVPTAVYTLIPTATPDPNQTLYYNPDGGSYYHASAECSKVSTKYRPLKASFKYSQLNDAQYKSLVPCTGCNAPNRQ